MSRDEVESSVSDILDVISAVARSEEVAIALVPIAVIPQIILSGAIAP